MWKMDAKHKQSMSILNPTSLTNKTAGIFDYSLYFLWPCCYLFMSIPSVYCIMRASVQYLIRTIDSSTTTLPTHPKHPIILSTSTTSNSTICYSRLLTKNYVHKTQYTLICNIAINTILFVLAFAKHGYNNEYNFILLFIIFILMSLIS